MCVPSPPASAPSHVNLRKELGSVVLVIFFFCVGIAQAGSKGQEDIEELCAYDLLERARYG